MNDTRDASTAPRPGDVIFLPDGVNFTYVGPQARDDRGRFLSTPGLGDGCYEITAVSGDAYIARRAPDLDDALRSAVHDDGRRRAWQVTISLRAFIPDEIAALDRVARGEES